MNLFLDDYLAKTIKQYVTSNDQILICCETKYVDTFLGIPTGYDSFDAQVITQNRLTYATQLSVSFNLDDRYRAGSMQLTDIVTVEESKGSLGMFGAYKVIARGHGDASILCSFSSPETSRKFAGVLRQAIQQANAGSSLSTMSPAIVEERLRVLTQLHKDGLISESEFQQKRKEILSQL